MKKITDWFRSWNDKNKQDYNARMLRQVEHEAKHDIQPLVWNGNVYLAYCGTPIILADCLKTDLLESIQQSQEILINYRTENY